MHNKPALGAARADLLRHGGYETWEELMAARAANVKAEITGHDDEQDEAGAA